MSLTLKPQIDAIHSNDCSIVLSSNPTPRSSSGSDSPSEPVSVPMESSRELPPPSTLNRLPPVMPSSLPPPPGQWQGPEPMQQWLRAKAEEDRRAQEEEKTRQETLKLEQRRVEQMILSESLRAGVPPHMIPLIFAGIGGGSSHWTETVHQYTSHAQAARGFSAPTQSQQSFPASASTSQHPSMVLSQSTPADSQRDVPNFPIPNIHPHSSAVDGLPTGNSTAMSSGMATPVPAPLPAQPLPVDTRARIPPNLAGGHIAPHPSQGIPTFFRPPQNLPISFHHWVPPGSLPQSQVSSKGQGTEPSTPSDSASQPRLDYAQSSPGRKRKSQTAHAQLAAPSTRVAESVSQGTRSGKHISAGEQQQSGLPNVTDDPSHRRASEQISPGTRRGVPWNFDRQPSRERETQSEPSQQVEMLDAETLSEPSQDANTGSRSDGTTGSLP
ncbi:hypothetical protein N7490_004870 [Penicillium lividum]|nr:hypothetical protein N7490_004870 [Penicillium lividum]